MEGGTVFPVSVVVGVVPAAVCHWGAGRCLSCVYISSFRAPI